MAEEKPSDESRLVVACDCSAQVKAEDQGKESGRFTAFDAFGLLRSYSRHRDYVRLALTRVANELGYRAIEHDASKMLDDEFQGFARINAVARLNKFGSQEYREAMGRERETYTSRGIAIILSARRC